jgi:hypothetical protein
LPYHFHPDFNIFSNPDGWALVLATSPPMRRNDNSLNTGASLDGKFQCPNLNAAPAPTNSLDIVNPNPSENNR